MREAAKKVLFSAPPYPPPSSLVATKLFPNFLFLSGRATKKELFCGFPYNEYQIITEYSIFYIENIRIMVLLIDGNLENVADVCGKIGLF